MKIEQVILSFEKNIKEFKSGTIYLHCPRGVNLEKPFIVGCYLCEPESKPSKFHDIIIEMWCSDEVKKEIYLAMEQYSCFVLTDDVQYVTQNQYAGDFFHTIGVINDGLTRCIMENINNIPLIQSGIYTPPWYDKKKHDCVFCRDHDDGCPVEMVHGYFNLSRDDQQIVIDYFLSEGHQRAVDAYHLKNEYFGIPPGAQGAKIFHDWVASALGFIFRDDLTVYKSPDKNGIERRDIVGGIRSESGFWKRLLDKHHVEMATFEVKNYEKPKSEDFQQLCSYLGQASSGNLGFMVVNNNCPSIELDVEEKIRHHYSTSGKITFMLHSYRIVKLLELIESRNEYKVGRQMMDWYEENHLNGVNMNKRFG